MNDELRLLDADEVADLLRISRSAVYSMVSRQELPGVVRIGRRLRFDSEKLYEYLRRASSPTSTELE